MRIYTSYFANKRKLVEAGIQPIGIALYPPRWFGGKSLKVVAPTRSILKDPEFTEERYTNRYLNEVLANVDANGFIEALKELSQGEDVALCCYEKPGDFCHRHILAEWLNKQLGIEIVEFVPEKAADLFMS